jgi:hypothetical protein
MLRQNCDLAEHLVKQNGKQKLETSAAVAPSMSGIIGKVTSNNP